MVVLSSPVVLAFVACVLFVVGFVAAVVMSPVVPSVGSPPLVLDVSPSSSSSGWLLFPWVLLLPPG
ncbi:hypothetical protein [Nannocystis pusilla]|uniref:hypothetical protein n=1 Tax=Nannocystis pusilla TaxID=889268 RepID=UPI003B78DA16